MTDPDVRVVVLGLPREEKRLTELLDERAAAEELGRAIHQVLKKLERRLKQLERELDHG